MTWYNDSHSTNDTMNAEYVSVTLYVAKEVDFWAESRPKPDPIFEKGLHADPAA